MHFDEMVVGSKSLAHKDTRTGFSTLSNGKRFNLHVSLAQLLCLRFRPLCLKPHMMGDIKVGTAGPIAIGLTASRDRKVGTLET